MTIKQTIGISVKNNMPCLLVGNHGVGKSYAIREAANKKGIPLSRVIITQETTPEDLVFNFELKDGETVKDKRELLKAVENGEWIVLEEINMASPAVLTMLNGLLETDPESRYLRFQEEEMKPHKNFRLFATSNPTSYSGTNRMNDALLSRFVVGRINPDYRLFLKIAKKDYCTGNPALYEEAKAFVSAIRKVEKNYEIYISPREFLIYTKLRSQGNTKEDSLAFVLGRFYDLDESMLKDVAAMFEVEFEKEEILVLNNTELQKRIEDAAAGVKTENLQLKARLKVLEEQAEVLSKLRDTLNS